MWIVVYFFTDAVAVENKRTRSQKQLPKGRSDRKVTDEFVEAMRKKNKIFSSKSLIISQRITLIVVGFVTVSAKRLLV